MPEKEIIEMAKRMRQAFSNVQCFVFEKQELQLVKKTINAIGLRGLVRLRLADPKYPYLYIVEPDIRDCEKDCESKALKKIANGEVREELKKYFLTSFIRQCINYCIHEKTKSILSIIDKFLGKEK